MQVSILYMYTIFYAILYTIQNFALFSSFSSLTFKYDQQLHINFKFPAIILPTFFLLIDNNYNMVQKFSSDRRRDVFLKTS